MSHRGSLRTPRFPYELPFSSRSTLSIAYCIVFVNVFVIKKKPGKKSGTVLATPRGGRAQLVRLSGAFLADGAKYERQEHADEGSARLLSLGKRRPVHPVFRSRHPAVRLF